MVARRRTVLQGDKGWRLVDANTGTQVAATWADDTGLTIEQIEKALKGNRRIGPASL